MPEEPKMIKKLFIANAILTIPFAIGGLLAPAPVFAPFGVTLDAGGALIARGYASTLMAYVILLFMSRNTSDAKALTAFLVSMTIFNMLEFAVQLLAFLQKVAAAPILATVIVHGILTILCALALTKHTKSAAPA
jgi:hypothetical protein